jgi:hypothetical protein
MARSPDAQVSMIIGTQLVQKFNKEAKDIVRVYLAVIRLPSSSTDILISLNDPVKLECDPSIESAVCFALAICGNRAVDQGRHGRCWICATGMVYKSRAFLHHLRHIHFRLDILLRSIN